MRTKIETNERGKSSQEVHKIERKVRAYEPESLKKKRRGRIRDPPPVRGKENQKKERIRRTEAVPEART